MNRLKILMACAICFLINYAAVAQDELTEALDKDSKKDIRSYNILSLEGKKGVIHLMPDYLGHKLKISFLKDTITINDYWGVPAETMHLNETFLQIKYEVRGGSNLGLGNMLLLCVSGNKLYEALHILRYADWESTDVKKYNVDVLLHRDKTNFALTASVREKASRQTDPEDNYHFNSKTELQFDRKLKVFYSIKYPTDDVFDISYPSTGAEYKRQIQGTFPKVLLGKMEYLFIGDQWFELDDSSLTKY